MILVNVCVQLFGPQNLGDLDELIVIVVSVEEGLFAENLWVKVRRVIAIQDCPDHRRKHAAVAPHIETVIILLEIHQELRALEVA